jgi:hypothetical protein
MEEEIEVRRLKVSSIFELLGLGYLFFFVPFALIMGIFSLFGAETIHWNSQPITGIPGLITSPFIGAFIALLFTGFSGVTVSIGLWIFSNLKPLTIHYMAQNPVYPTQADTSA